MLRNDYNRSMEMSLYSPVLIEFVQQELQNTRSSLYLEKVNNDYFNMLLKAGLIQQLSLVFLSILFMSEKVKIASQQREEDIKLATEKAKYQHDFSAQQQAESKQLVKEEQRKDKELDNKIKEMMSQNERLQQEVPLIAAWSAVHDKMNSRVLGRLEQAMQAGELLNANGVAISEEAQDRIKQGIAALSPVRAFAMLVKSNSQFAEEARNEKHVPELAKVVLRHNSVLQEFIAHMECANDQANENESFAARFFKVQRMKKNLGVIRDAFAIGVSEIAGDVKNAGREVERDFEKAVGVIVDLASDPAKLFKCAEHESNKQKIAESREVEAPDLDIPEAPPLSPRMR